ncbi:MAG: Molecular chaperone Tir [Frankiales bacterium]|nr:Molecular chaperone Tir [Frankiales bacterium]
MEHLRYDLGNLKKDSTVVVTLNNQANVQLMTSGDYNNYKAGRQYRYHGGRVTRSPFRIPVPSNGHWIVAVDLGGYTGRISASVAVQPPPRGFLPQARSAEENPASQVTVRDDPEEPDDDVLGGQTWDVFISHASEDKDRVARPLRDALARLGITVWLDEAQMRIGHSLRRKIDDGIRSSRFGVVILSEAFLRKGWTNHELDGLVTRTVAGEQSLLPIWHDLDAAQVRAFSPSLADKVALSTGQFSIQEIAEQIAEVVNEPS